MRPSTSATKQKIAVEIVGMITPAIASSDEPTPKIVPRTRSGEASVIKAGSVAFVIESANAKIAIVRNRIVIVCATGTRTKKTQAEKKPMFEARRTPTRAVSRPTTAS